MNFMQILQLLNLIVRILELLDANGKEKVAKAVAGVINKPG